MTPSSSSRSPLLAPLPQGRSALLIPSPSEAGHHMFHPHSTMNLAGRVGLQSAGVGLLVSAVQNALDRHDKGAMGIVTRTGGTIAFFAAMGFTFSFTQAAVSNFRETDDALNGVAGGCAAGFIAGVRARSIPMAVGSCAALGAAVGTFAAAGNSLTGTDRLSMPRPEREERRLQFFKQPKAKLEEATA